MSGIISYNKVPVGARADRRPDREQKCMDFVPAAARAVIARDRACIRTPRGALPIAGRPRRQRGCARGERSAFRPGVRRVPHLVAGTVKRHCSPSAGTAWSRPQVDRPRRRHRRSNMMQRFVVYVAWPQPWPGARPRRMLQPCAACAIISSHSARRMCLYRRRETNEWRKRFPRR